MVMMTMQNIIIGIIIIIAFVHYALYLLFSSTFNQLYFIFFLS